MGPNPYMHDRDVEHPDAPTANSIHGSVFGPLRALPKITLSMDARSQEGDSDVDDVLNQHTATGPIVRQRETSPPKRIHIPFGLNDVRNTKQTYRLLMQSNACNSRLHPHQTTCQYEKIL